MIRTRQPSGAVAVAARFNSAASFVWSGNFGSVSGVRPYVSTAAKGYGPEGAAAKFSGSTSEQISFPLTSDYVNSGYSGDVTLVVLHTPAGSAGVPLYVGPYYYAGYTVAHYFEFGSGTSNATSTDLNNWDSAGGPALVAGNTYGEVGRFIYGGGRQHYINGSLVGESTTARSVPGVGVAHIGAYVANSSCYNSYNGLIYLAAFLPFAVSDADARSLSRNPWQLFAPQRRLWIQLGAAAGGTTAYDLDAQPGGYTISGTAATLLRGIVLDAQPATYTVSGTAATLVRGYNLDAQPGSFTATGSAATLARGYVVDAAPGSFAVTGIAATLEYTQPGVYSLNAEPGAYSLTGVAATLTYTPVNVYSLDAQPGSYAITGAAAGLTYTGASIWTDIGVSAATWSDVGGVSSIWTDL